MGIPYLFASLTKNHPGIIKTLKKDEDFNVDVLAIDFNCLIHRYLADDNPVHSVLEALDHIMKETCRSKQVFIALDGIVPYAKIVNQRYRRMKVSESGVFDRNQISPDTPYMRELEEAVRQRFPSAILSPTQEAGEGEHKLFHFLKQLPQEERNTICIYGLDADLILISMCNAKLCKDMWLLRESGEFNDPKLTHAEFATLHVQTLIYLLPIELKQYVYLCVLCFGNDFMPTLGMFSLREDGYSRALHIYQQAGNPDLSTFEGRDKFLDLAEQQELSVLTERVRLRRRPDERAILGKQTSELSVQYGLHILDGVRDMKPVVEAFWKTFHWTIHYFFHGEVLDWTWVYPYPDAPLLQDILNHDETLCTTHKLQYTLSQHLKFILPAKSLRITRKRVQYPDELYTETRNPWMKKFEWETKPRISLPWNPKYELTRVEEVG